jgi:hypothetical protein
LLLLAGKFTGYGQSENPKVSSVLNNLPENDKSPDISIRRSTNDFANPSYTYLAAVLTCPIQGSRSCKLVAPSAKDAQQQGRRAKVFYDGKIRHYEKILGEARENNPEDSVQRRPKQPNSLPNPMKLTS